MKKLSLSLILIVVIVLAGFALVRFIAGGSEDNWICENNQWVRHGNPAGPPPQTGCGKKPVIPEASSPISASSITPTGIVGNDEPIVTNSASTGVPVSTKAVVGNDADIHGCIGSAGYSWCEPKNKCLRIWEEACYTGVSQEIQYLLAKKYNKSVDEVKITISKQDENYAGGSVLFGRGGPGEAGLFLARKAGNMWEVVFDGNGSVDCTKMRQEYGFPDSILKPNFCG